MPLLWEGDPRVEAVLEHDVGTLELALELWETWTPADRLAYAASLVHELRVRVRRLDLPAEVVPEVARDRDALVSWLDDPTTRAGFLEAIARRREAGP